MGLGCLRHAAAVSALTQAALAPSTQRAYHATWNSLSTFLQRRPPAPLFPVSTSEVADFVGSRFQAGCGAAALATHCSAIAFGHRIRGLPDPTADFRIRKLLAGARRLRPSCDIRIALSVRELDLLREAVASLPIGVVEKAAFRAIFSLAFFGMLRPGEVLLGADPAHTIRVQHVHVHHGQLRLTIPSSKSSAVPFTMVLLARPDLPACPVRAMCEYLRVRPRGGPQDYMFVSDTGRTLTTRSLTRMVRRAGQNARLDLSRLSGHCFRIGGASHGAQQGMAELQLCEAGRWSLSAVRRYLRQPVSLLQFASADG